MKLSVIVPAYNESRHIVANIRALDRTLSNLRRPYEIIIVDDASTDNTLRLAKREAGRNQRVAVVSCRKNGGKGQALRRGFSKATGGFIGFVDGDMDLHPRQLNLLIQQLERDRADIAVGSKLHPQSQVQYPAFRRFLSYWYRLLIRLLFNLKVRDTQVGLKVFNRAVLDEVMPRLVVKRFAFDVELLAVANYYGYTRVIEVPISLDYQFSSTVKFKDVRWMLQDTLGVFYRLRIKHYYQQQRPEPVARVVSEGAQLSNLESPPVANWKVRWLKRKRRR